MSERVRFRDLSQACEVLSPAELRFERARRTVGLFAGPALFLALLLAPPPGLAPPAARLVAVLAWILTWWVTEAVPIPVASVLGPALAVPLGVGTASEMFAPFGDPIVFLFLGGFVLAEAMFATGLDRRFAYAILARRWVGSSSTRILAAFAVATAGLSAWLSNTATTAMLYPIALSVLAALSRLLERAAGGPVDATRLRFGTSLMLTIAWASSIGGIVTPVGTPPNLVVLGQLDQLAGVRVSFFQWMLVGAPIAAVMLALLLAYLRWALPAEVGEVRGSRDEFLRERAALGAPSRAERNVLAAFSLTVALWVLPGLLALVLGTEAPVARQVQRWLPESVVAVFGAALLFVLPVDWRARRFTLRWSEAVRIDWGTLLLFGGGLSLGAAMFRTGLAEAVGQGIVRATGAQSLAALTVLFTLLAILLTETTSNTAAATMVGPLAIAAAQAAGVSPVPPAMAVALSASMAFMLPVSTPPNAIVYGSGCVPITVMLRLGTALDLASAIVVPIGVLLLTRLFGIG
ncbi:MAG: SLC13 family permease [Acidobacteria bacterium]|nr:SLC13 family permease [Acidobacteriota bacterium]